MVLYLFVHVIIFQILLAVSYLYRYRVRVRVRASLNPCRNGSYYIYGIIVFFCLIIWLFAKILAA